LQTFSSPGAVAMVTSHRRCRSLSTEVSPLIDKKLGSDLLTSSNVVPASIIVGSSDLGWAVVWVAVESHNEVTRSAASRAEASKSCTDNKRVTMHFMLTIWNCRSNRDW
jgi:hypothetical protein